MKLVSMLFSAAVLRKKLRLLLLRLILRKKVPSIIAIGDSWLNRRLFDRGPLHWDTIDWIKQKYPLINCAIPGYTLEDEIKNRLCDLALKIVNLRRPLVIVLSLGGNDMLNIFSSFMSGSGSKCKLKKKHLTNFIKTVMFPQLKRYVTSLVRQYEKYGHLKYFKIIIHGYEYFHPEKEPNSKFTAMLKEFFYNNNVPIPLASKIVREFVDITNKELLKLAKETPCLEVVDLRGKIPKKYWGEQIHPTPEGYAIVAAKIMNRIDVFMKSTSANF